MGTILGSEGIGGNVGKEFKGTWFLSFSLFCDLLLENVGFFYLEHSPLHPWYS